MEFCEKRKFFSLRPPARKGREISGWVQWVKWCPHIGQQMHCWQTVAAGPFWPCFACPKLGDAGKMRVASKNREVFQKAQRSRRVEGGGGPWREGGVFGSLGSFSFGFLKDSKAQWSLKSRRFEGGGGAMEGGRSPHLRNCQSVSGRTQSATTCRYSHPLLGSDLGFDILCV